MNSRRSIVRSRCAGPASRLRTDSFTHRQYPTWPGPRTVAFGGSPLAYGNDRHQSIDYGADTAKHLVAESQFPDMELLALTHRLITALQDFPRAIGEHPNFFLLFMWPGLLFRSMLDGRGRLGAVPAGGLRV